jgi:hypothetical protein
MDRKNDKDTVKRDMDADFLPDPSPDTLNQFDRRITNAAEYTGLPPRPDRQEA